MPAAELNEAEGRKKAEERARAGAAADEEELTQEEEARLAAAALARMRARKAAKEEEAAKARERMEEEAAEAAAKAREDEDARRTQDAARDAARDAEMALARERASSLRSPRQRVDPPTAPTKPAGEGSEAGAREAEAGKKNNADCGSYYTAYERMCVVVFLLLCTCPHVILVLLCVCSCRLCVLMLLRSSGGTKWYQGKKKACISPHNKLLCVLMQASCCGL
jgi:hypothetical protein